MNIILITIIVSILSYWGYVQIKNIINFINELDNHVQLMKELEDERKVTEFLKGALQVKQMQHELFQNQYMTPELYNSDKYQELIKKCDTLVYIGLTLKKRYDERPLNKQY